MNLSQSEWCAPKHSIKLQCNEAISDWMMCTKRFNYNIQWIIFRLNHRPPKNSIKSNLDWIMCPRIFNKITM